MTVRELIWYPWITTTPKDPSVPQAPHKNLSLSSQHNLISFCHFLPITHSTSFRLHYRTMAAPDTIRRMNPLFELPNALPHLHKEPLNPILKISIENEGGDVYVSPTLHPTLKNASKVSPLLTNTHQIFLPALRLHHQHHSDINQKHLRPSRLQHYKPFFDWELGQLVEALRRRRRNLLLSSRTGDSSTGRRG
jgi:hypothetical protein